MTHSYETRCPYCHRRNPAATAITRKDEATKVEPVPNDGAISLCAGCGGLSIFSFMTPGGLRFPQPEELAEIEASEMGRKLRALRESKR